MTKPIGTPFGDYVGYKGAVVVPILIEPVDPGPVDLVLEVGIGVCDGDLCVPVEATVSARLEAGKGLPWAILLTDAERARRFEADFRQAPGSSGEPCFEAVSAEPGAGLDDSPGEDAFVLATDGGQELFGVLLEDGRNRFCGSFEAPQEGRVVLDPGGRGAPGRGGTPALSRRPLGIAGRLGQEIVYERAALGSDRLVEIEAQAVDLPGVRPKRLIAARLTSFRVRFRACS